MVAFPRLLRCEALKVRHSAALRLVWGLPLFFLLLDFALFGRTFIEGRSVSSDVSQTAAALPLKAVGMLWAGFFHPLWLALIPALLFRPEHRFSQWKHLHALPVSAWRLFLAKTTTALVLLAVSLSLIVFGLWLEWQVIHRFNPVLSFIFPWREMSKVMGWLLLGSLPLLALYLWLSDRINSGVVPILFGLIGLMLNISLSGQEIDPSWRRDLIPWVLPYSCVQQAIERTDAKQEAHVAGLPFRREIDLNRLAGKEVYYLPSGRKVTSYTTIPSYFLLPPPPTPNWLLAAFSAGAGSLLLLVGLLDTKRNRA